MRRRHLTALCDQEWHVVRSRHCAPHTWPAPDENICFVTSIDQMTVGRCGRSRCLRDPTNSIRCDAWLSVRGRESVSLLTTRPCSAPLVCQRAKGQHCEGELRQQGRRPREQCALTWRPRHRPADPAALTAQPAMLALHVICTFPRCKRGGSARGETTLIRARTEH